MAGFVTSETDRKHIERYEELKQIEMAFRKAIREDTRLYDADLQTVIAQFSLAR